MTNIELLNRHLRQTVFYYTLIDGSTTTAEKRLVTDDMVGSWCGPKTQAQFNRDCAIRTYLGGSNHKERFVGDKGTKYKLETISFWPDALKIAEQEYFDIVDGIYEDIKSEITELETIGMKIVYYDWDLE
jgi:hypothetical protein